MPTSYHHGNLRQALVDAAVQAVRERGPEALVLREIARAVGVSHNAAYRHFADRDALVEEVARVGLAALARAGAERMAAVTGDDAVEVARTRLRELGRSYVEFAVAEPGLFRVAFASYPSLAAEGESVDEQDDSFVQLGACLDELVDVGYLAPSARPGSELTCWSAVHGLAMLFIEGPLQGSGEAERTEVVTGVLATIDRSYGATTGRVTPS